MELKNAAGHKHTVQNDSSVFGGIPETVGNSVQSHSKIHSMTLYETQVSISNSNFKNQAF